MKEFRKKKVLVVGDLVLDRYIWGKVSRISPEAPVPIVEVTDEVFNLGGASNVANNIVALGGQATIVGVAGGNDRGGEVLRKMFQARGIRFDGVYWSSRPTTMKTRVIAHSQQVVRFDREDRTRIAGSALKSLLNYLRFEVQGYDAVIISDYKKGVISSGLVREIMKIASPEHIFVSVDPKVGHFHCYKGVSLITPNVHEASQASGIEIRDERSLINAGRALLRKVSCDAVLITRGEHGMSLFRKNKVVHIPTVAKNVYDVTGAGDTVIATFTLVHAAGASMEEAAVIANHAGGIVVGEVGTAVVTPGQLEKSLSSNAALKIREFSYN
ncbi:MAG TPA: D-glycero-beta-D-manno-heptose-7-phosphate kinase [Thermodesulfovibrionales bacterium]|nr:D-glycero-beta-D-manno-heptose-7-phosphate kinase [Thermodesulfovibrionales bacterium]